MKLTASYSICYARKKGEIKILTKSSSPHDKPIEKCSYTHARGTKNLALCVCLFLERECKDKWKKEKEKEHEKEYRGERGDIGNVGSHTQWKSKKDSHHSLLFLILLLVYLPLFLPLLGPYMAISLSLSPWTRDRAFLLLRTVAVLVENLTICHFVAFLGFAEDEKRKLNIHTWAVISWANI